MVRISYVKPLIIAFSLLPLMFVMVSNLGYARFAACKTSYQSSYPLDNLGGLLSECQDDCMSDDDCNPDLICDSVLCPDLDELGIPVQIAKCVPRKVPSKAETQKVLEECISQESKAYANKFKSKKLGLSIQSRKTPGVTVQINSNINFTAASIPKIGILLAAYALLQDIRIGKLNQKETEIQFPDIFDFTKGIQFVEFKPWFNTLLTSACSASSNSASNTLINLLGRDRIQSTLTKNNYFDPVTKTGIWLGGYFGSEFKKVGPKDRTVPMSIRKHPDLKVQSMNVVTAQSMLALMSDVSLLRALPRELAESFVGNCNDEDREVVQDRFSDDLGVYNFQKVGYLDTAGGHSVYHLVTLDQDLMISITCEREVGDKHDCEMIVESLVEEIPLCLKQGLRKPAVHAP